MDIYVARQPIFDQKMNTFAYELLYRRSQNNVYEGTDGSQATAEVINNAFLSMNFEDLTGGTRAFINFNSELLLRGVPLLLPRDKIVVEVLETVEPTEEMVAVCRKLRQEGYLLALDDFVFHPRFEPLIALADLIKIEYQAYTPNQHKLLLTNFRRHYPRLQFLAEKIETREEYETARDLGYHYFQGYFFSRPILHSQKTIRELNTSLLSVLQELQSSDPRYPRIADIIGQDFALTYKLLKLANSTYFSPASKIRSVQQALAWLGISEMTKWVHLMLLQDLKTPELNELIRTSIVRARVLELIASKPGSPSQPSESFMLGMFSSLDIILDRPMKDALQELPLTTDLQEALLGHSVPLRQLLDHVLAYEQGVLQSDDPNYNRFLARYDLPTLYLDAIRWQNQIT